MIENPLVSIIVPCYNHGKFLAEALNSVLGQSLTAWECIIIDDGSLDNSSVVAQSYIEKDCRFKYIYQDNKGLSAARNTGLSHSNGKYVQLLDSDDYLHLNKLKAQVEFLENNSSIDIVFSDALFFEIIGEKKNFYSCPYPNENNDYANLVTKLTEAFVTKNLIPCCAPLINFRVFNSIGFFDEELFSLEDWDFWLRAVLNGKNFHYLNTDDGFSYVRQIAGSMRANIWNMYYNEIKVRQKNMALLNPLLEKINKFQIQERKNSLLYFITEEKSYKNKSKYLFDLKKLLSIKRLFIFKFLLRVLPQLAHHRVVTLLYSNKNVVRQ